MTLEEFADKHDLTLVINERRDPSLPRFYAQFKNCEVKECGVLRLSYGDGDTPEKAIENYQKEINLKTIVIDAYMSNRREIDAPHLI